MPILVALIGLLGQALASYVPRILIALGMSYVTYKGFSAFTGQLAALFNQSLNLPSYVVGFLGLLQLGKCFNIVLSAVTVKWTLKGLSSSLTKLQFNGPKA